MDSVKSGTDISEYLKIDHLFFSAFRAVILVQLKNFCFSVPSLHAVWQVDTEITALSLFRVILLLLLDNYEWLHLSSMSDSARDMQTLPLYRLNLLCDLMRKILVNLLYLMFFKRLSRNMRPLAFCLLNTYKMNVFAFEVKQ